MTGARRLLPALLVTALAAVSLAPAARPDDPTPVAAARTAQAARDPHGVFELTSESRPARPLRWLACRPIEYRINPAHQPAGMTRIVKSVMASIGKQTGVRFRYAGRTKHHFSSTTHARIPTIYFAFTDKRRAAGQTFAWPGQVGLGGPAGAWYLTGDDQRYEAIVYGRVLLSTRFAGSRSGAGVSWRSLIMHEVGHALNLDHRAAETDVMHASLTARTPPAFSKRELAALGKVLQTTGCDYGAWSRL